MKQCENCHGEIETGDHHRSLHECIRFLADRINAIIAKLQGAPVPGGQTLWPTA